MTKKTTQRGLTRPLSREEVRGRLQIPSKFFLALGFSAEVLDRFDVGKSDKFGRVIVPLYDETGESCIGFTYRSFKPQCGTCRKHHDPWVDCKWGQVTWGNSKGFKKRAYLYNLAAARRTDSHFILLVEGPPEVWRAAEAGVVAVALLGADATDEQLRLLADLDKPIRVAFDSNEGGRAAEERFLRKIKASRLDFPMEFFAVPPPYTDFGDVPADALRRAITTMRPGSDEENLDPD